MTSAGLPGLCAARPGERAPLPREPARAGCGSGVGLSRHGRRCEVHARCARRMLACSHAPPCARALRLKRGLCAAAAQVLATIRAHRCAGSRCAGPPLPFPAPSSAACALAAAPRTLHFPPRQTPPVASDRMPSARAGEALQLPPGEGSSEAESGARSPPLPPLCAARERVLTLTPDPPAQRR